MDGMNWAVSTRDHIDYFKFGASGAPLGLRRGCMVLDTGPPVLGQRGSCALQGATAV